MTLTILFVLTYVTYWFATGSSAFKMDRQTTQGYSTIIAKDCFDVTTITMGFINIKIDLYLNHSVDNYHFTIANSS